MLVYIDGSAFLTTNVQSQTDIPAQGPEIERSELGKISELMIHGSPLAPNDHVAPNIIIAAVAALPPATVLAEGCAKFAGLDGFATAI